MKKLLSLFCAVLLVMGCMVIPATTSVAAADSAFVWDFEDYELGEEDTPYLTLPSNPEANGTFLGRYLSAAYAAKNIGVLPAPGQGKNGSNAMKIVNYNTSASGNENYIGFFYNFKTPLKSGVKVTGSFKTRSATLDVITGEMTYDPENDYNRTLFDVQTEFKRSNAEGTATTLRAGWFYNYDSGIKWGTTTVPAASVRTAMGDWEDFEMIIDIPTGDAYLHVEQYGETIAEVYTNMFDAGLAGDSVEMNNFRFNAGTHKAGSGYEIILDNLCYQEIGNYISAQVFDVNSLLASANSALLTAPKGFTLEGAVENRAGVIKNGTAIDLKNVANNPQNLYLGRGMAYDAFKHKITTTIKPVELANRSIIVRDTNLAEHSIVDFKEDGSIVVGGETLGTYTAGTAYDIEYVANETTGLVHVTIDDGVNEPMRGTTVLPSATNMVKFAYVSTTSTVASATTISAISYTPYYPIPVSFTDNEDGTATAVAAAEDLGVISGDMALVVNVYDKATNALLDVNVEAFDETVLSAPEITVPFNAATQYAEAYLFDGLATGNTETAKITLGTPDASTLGATDVVGTTFSANNSRVDGSITLKNAGITADKATLLMLPDGVTPADFALDPENIQGYFKSFEGETVDGIKFGFSSDVNAIYDFYINKNDGRGFQLIGDISYVSPAVVVGLVEELNESTAVYKDIVLAESAPGVASNREMLNLNTAVYEAYEPADFDYAQRYLEQERGNYTADSFKDAFEMMEAVRAVVNATDATGVQGAMDAYFEPLRYDLYQVWDTYEAIEEEKQPKVLTAVAGAPEFFDFEEVFEKHAIFTALRYAGNQINVKAVVDATYDIIGISEDDYDAYCDLIDKAPVNKALRGKTYTDLEDIVDDFDEALEKQIAVESGEAEEEEEDDRDSSNKKYNSSISIANGYVPPVITPVTPAPGASAEAFADVADGHWAKEGISYLAKAGIVNGKAAGEFAPDALVKREEVAKMIVLAFGGLKDAEKAGFGDVNADAWYAPYIATAVANGFVSGYSADWFGIGDNVSRQDMAVMIYKAAKAFGLELPAGELSFTDNDKIADYAKEGVSALVALGSISGRDDGSFDAGATATRAEIAKILYDVMLKGGMTK